MDLIRTTLKTVRLGEPKTEKGLTVFPLFGPAVTEREYITLEDALEAGTARVTEVSGEGSVPELKFDNEGAQPVILIDGATLLGAKQDRVINITIVAPGKMVTVIPVSCCEAGRWHRRSAAFKSAGYTMYAEARAAKTAQVSRSMATTGSRSSDQGAIWRDIAMKMGSVGSRSDTSAMNEMYSQLGERIESYAEKFPSAEGQTGVLLGLDGRITGLDLFDNSETLAAYLPQLLRSCAVDALGRGEEAERPTPVEAAEEFFTDVAEAVVRQYPAVGLGEDLRFESGKVTGGALAISGRIVHLAAFRSDQ